MSKILNLIFVLVSCFVSQSVFSESKALCSELSNFANSIEPNSKHSVKFASNWSKMKRSCEHHSYKPGMKLCLWMMQNNSGEFMEYNVASVMSCLGSPSYLKAKNSMLNNATGNLVIFEIDGIKDSVSIELEYSVRQTAESSITITAESE